MTETEYTGLGFRIEKTPNNTYAIQFNRNWSMPAFRSESEACMAVRTVIMAEADKFKSEVIPLLAFTLDYHKGDGNVNASTALNNTALHALQISDRRILKLVRKLTRYFTRKGELFENRTRATMGINNWNK